MADEKKAAQETAERKQKVVDEAYKRMSAGKPTPTQQENDRAALGEHVAQHEADGSEEEPRFGEQKQAEAKPGQRAGYQTRQVPPA
jgi:hypothetical protein